MKNNIFTKRTKLVLLIAIVAAFLAVPLITNAGTKNSSMKQVYTSIEGNITYYVKPGQKVKKGTPLFFVENNANSPSKFFELQNDIDYNKIIYARMERLIKTHSVSWDDFDTARHGLIGAETTFASFIRETKMGFYTAPFDCEVTKILYTQGSGIGDGNPAINIKPTDVNYHFEPAKLSKKLVGLMKRSSELSSTRAKDLNVKKITF
ncbi:MAG TPA: hypothetical protein QF753_13785 [Victivallales bacterium]|nr:hypothetical protein [Victivallales bacterium]